MNKLVDGSLVNLVSNSYGDIGEDISAGTKTEFDQIATQAAATGIGLYFSSGDDGDNTDSLSQPASMRPPAPAALIRAVRRERVISSLMAWTSDAPAFPARPASVR